ncbi:hypothetical protein [Poseidonibacter ostreae]|jgi:hypothetical protein|uniref:Uncharacterized protein n=1 Tax=Poseidonibacter ostreae TaxID=2654171 RepID=A0A6L4WVA0_9BACT|nr:hypothetical protein [Poseidonibacter ostreae]KAB7886789.1 hypothetical protein GA417_04315 [Poseidonibacter ostreae]KAB7890432.1 hypothetical protein GBG19_02955 [Poseidonibacter ostreae]KAB7892283.1 hypothetical protein GBG18_03245 [Poseidonibacter ostreae]
MYKTLSISILSTIFIGCSSTTALKHFNKNEIEAKAMQYTKKADVIINKEQKALLWATYLNNTDIKEFNSKDEVFVTSVYFVNQDNQDINENGYSFTLNEQKPKSIEEIAANDERYKDILSKNTWGKYYLVKFNQVENTYNLTLTLSNKNSNSAKLTFEK